MLINLVQAELGIAETSPARAKRRYRSRIADRDQAQAAGAEGRRANRGSKSVTMSAPEDLAMIDAQLSIMGWTQERLKAFLKSKTSPIQDHPIRTLADVNKVLWALKRIHRHPKERP